MPHNHPEAALASAPAGGEERSQDPVVNLGVEDGELQPVGDEVVGAGVRSAGDQPVAGQPTQVVRGPGPSSRSEQAAMPCAGMTSA